VKRVVVVGAGMSGLACAWALRGRADVVVIEGSARVGGNVITLREAGFTMDAGPDAWVTTKPEGRGTGLGLSITRDVITRFGGTVAVASEPGHGATFTIRMPADAGRTAHDADAADS